mmetsp:Transcript_51932/g.166260  ORF Transcript_51932/g.166260 Transcript_51932/m.166260 type:complete len:255 (+) Transcript_51932:2639-3403(+)
MELSNSRLVSWLLKVQCFMTVKTPCDCTPCTYALANLVPRYGSSPERNSKLRPPRAILCTSTEGPKIPFAPLPANSLPNAMANACTASGSQVDAMASNEGQQVTVPTSSCQYVRKPPAASCILRLGMSRRGTAAVLPTYHHFCRLVPTQPMPRSRACFSSTVIRIKVPRAAAYASSHSMGWRTGGNVTGEAEGVKNVQAPPKGPPAAWARQCTLARMGEFSHGCVTFPCQQAHGAFEDADQQAVAVPDGQRVSW